MFLYVCVHALKSCTALRKRCISFPHVDCVNVDRGSPRVQHESVCGRGLCSVSVESSLPGRDSAGTSWSLMWLSRAPTSVYARLQAWKGHGVLAVPVINKQHLTHLLSNNSVSNGGYLANMLPRLAS